MYSRIFLVSLAVLGLVSGPAFAQLDSMAELGKELFFDKISDPDSMSCADCHGEKVGFTGPIAGINKKGSVYRGAVPQRFGNRKPPSSGYATLSPVLNFDMDEELFVGGNFWDGRATGWILGNPAADQALGPFLNPVEQNNPSKQAVIDQVCDARYADLFVDEFQSFYASELDPCDPENVENAYNFIGLAIMEYEASGEVNQFSSKYDAYLENCMGEGYTLEACGTPGFDSEKGDYDPSNILTQQQWDGLVLFVAENNNDGIYDDGEGGMCAACHPTTVVGDEPFPVLTDFTYDNLGVPKNPENPFYRMDQVLLDNGEPINPEGADWVDNGLGDFLRSLAADDAWKELDYVEDPIASMTITEEMAADNDGKQKVPTLRNVGKRPGRNFSKTYTHNGFFKSLKGVVHFYNTRDAKDPCPPETEYTERDALAQGCWPAPEVAANVNTDELGDLGLNSDQEDAIVAFMETLSDGASIEKGKRR